MKLHDRAMSHEREFVKNLEDCGLDIYMFDKYLNRVVRYVFKKKHDRHYRDKGFDYDKAIAKLPPNRLTNPLWELRDQARVKLLPKIQSPERQF